MHINKDSLREIVQTTIKFREGMGFIYRPAAVDEVCGAVMQQSPFKYLNDYLDAIEEYLIAEEKDFGRDDWFFQSIALPGWLAWSESRMELV